LLHLCEVLFSLQVVKFVYKIKGNLNLRNLKFKIKDKDNR